MTEKQFKYLEQYKDTFEKAYKQSYAHMLPRKVNETLNLMINGEPMNYGCPACCLKLYKRLWIKYNEELQERDRKNKEKMEKARQAKKNNKETDQQEEDGECKEE